MVTILANNLNVNIGSQLYDSFATSATPRPIQKAQRKSIARGEALFSHKAFIINKVAGLNDIKGDAGPDRSPVPARPATATKTC